MSRRLVAITQRVVALPERDEVRDTLDQRWATWVEGLGIVPVPVPNRTRDIEAFVDDTGVSAIFLTGGDDIYPSVEGESPAAAEIPYRYRDRVEFELVALAAQRRLPLLAWCRGLQVLQVFFGGHLSSTLESSVEHVAATHRVEICDERYRSLAGRRSIEVNSYHALGIPELALIAPLRPMAISADGFIESAYHPKLPIVGCQWHPERSGGSPWFDELLVRKTLADWPPQ